MTMRMFVRQQRPKRGGRGWSGPDTYVAVVSIHEGVEMPKILRRDVMRTRGIEFRYIGEGYKEHTSLRSALGQHIQTAKRIITESEAGMQNGE